MQQRRPQMQHQRGGRYKSAVIPPVQTHARKAGTGQENRKATGTEDRAELARTMAREMAATMPKPPPGRYSRKRAAGY